MSGRATPRLTFGALLGLTLVTAAMAGRVYHEQTPLKSVIRDSNLIAIAHPADPHRVTVKIPIPGTPKLDPYTRADSRWVLDEVLHSRLDAKAPTKGETIQVAPAEWSHMMRLHVRYHREGLSKSPIYPEYRPRGALPKEGGPVLLFLRQVQHDQGAQWEYTAIGAMESVAERAAVEAELKGGAPKKAAPAQGAQPSP